MKKIFRFFRPFVSGIFIIFIFNKMALSLDIFIPLNVFTVLIVGIFDIPGLIMLVVMNMIMF